MKSERFAGPGRTQITGNKGVGQAPLSSGKDSRDNHQRSTTLSREEGEEEDGEEKVEG
jgi:hypothetical protein